MGLTKDHAPKPYVGAKMGGRSAELATGTTNRRDRLLTDRKGPFLKWRSPVYAERRLDEHDRIGWQRLRHTFL